MQLLMEHPWPGNVRELENLAKRAVVLGSESAIRKELQHAASHARFAGSGGAAVTRVTSPPPPPAPAASLPAATAGAGHAAAAPTNGSPVEPAVVASRFDPTAPSQCSLKDIARHAARAAERELILRMLQHTRWNRKEAAEILGISYKALLYKIKENGLDKAS